MHLVVPSMTYNTIKESTSSTMNNRNIPSSEPNSPRNHRSADAQVQRHQSLKGPRVEGSDMKVAKPVRSVSSMTVLGDSTPINSPLIMRRNVSTGSLRYLQIPNSPSPKSSPRLVRARQRISRLLTFKMTGDGPINPEEMPSTMNTVTLSNGMQRKNVSIKQRQSLDSLCSEAAANVEEQNDIYNVLTQCIREDECKAFKTLLRRKFVDVNQVLENSASLLHEASFKGCVKCMKALIKYGCDINKADSHGWTPLHASIFSSQIEAVKLLLELKSFVNYTSLCGWSPLHLSVYLNDLYISHELVQNGADPLLCNSYGISPFQLAINLEKALVLDYFLLLPCFLVQSK